MVMDEFLYIFFAIFIYFICSKFNMIIEYGL